MGTGGTRGRVSNKDWKEREVVVPGGGGRFLLRQVLASYWPQIQGD